MQDVGEAAIRLSVRRRFEPPEPLLHRVQLSDRRTTVSDTAATAESGNLSSRDVFKKKWAIAVGLAAKVVN